MVIIILCTQKHLLYIYFFFNPSNDERKSQIGTAVSTIKKPTNSFFSFSIFIFVFYLTNYNIRFLPREKKIVTLTCLAEQTISHERTTIIIPISCHNSFENFYTNEHFLSIPSTTHVKSSKFPDFGFTRAKKHAFFAKIDRFPSAAFLFFHTLLKTIRKISLSIS